MREDGIGMCFIYHVGRVWWEMEAWSFYFFEQFHFLDSYKTIAA
jgi:hypothetical protein